MPCRWSRLQNVRSEGPPLALHYVNIAFVWPSTTWASQYVRWYLKWLTRLIIGLLRLPTHIVFHRFGNTGSADRIALTTAPLQRKGCVCGRQHGGKCAFAVKSWAILERDQCDALWEIKCPTDHNDLCRVLEHLQNFEPSLFSWLLMINDAVIRTTLALYLPVLRSPSPTPVLRWPPREAAYLRNVSTESFTSADTPAWDESLWRRSHDSIPRLLSGYR